MVERFEVQRTIPASPDAIFRVLCDPAGHVTIDSSGMLMSSTGGSVAVTRVKMPPRFGGLSPGGVQAG